MKTGWITTKLLLKAGNAAVTGFQCLTDEREEHVEAFLQGYLSGACGFSRKKVPVDRQIGVDVGGARQGRIDLFVRGVNPKPVEIAAQPAKAKVHNRLCPSQNRKEVFKLCSFGPSEVRQRILYLLDFGPNPKDPTKLIKVYRKSFSDFGRSNQVRVIYCHSRCSFHFELFPRNRRDIK